MYVCVTCSPFSYRKETFELSLHRRTPFIIFGGFHRKLFLPSLVTISFSLSNHESIRPLIFSAVGHVTQHRQNECVCVQMRLIFSPGQRWTKMSLASLLPLVPCSCFSHSFFCISLSFIHTYAIFLKRHSLTYSLTRSRTHMITHTLFRAVRQRGFLPTFRFAAVQCWGVNQRCRRNVCIHRIPFSFHRRRRRPNIFFCGNAFSFSPHHCPAFNGLLIRPEATAKTTSRNIVPVYTRL